MMNSKTIQYNSLEELRSDIKKTERKLSNNIETMEEEVKACFLPANREYIDSPTPYMRYVGYGITAYKTFNVVRKLITMIKTKRWF